MFSSASKKNFGTRTPLVLRCAAFLGYAEISRRGVRLLFWDSLIGGDDVGRKVDDACWAILLFAGVYLVETLNALFLGWISLQGAHMFHMYEHHLTGLGLGLALSAYVHTNDDATVQSFVDLVQLPLSVGLLAHLCETWAVARTFLPVPDERKWKAVQRLLGVVLMAALSICILTCFHKYLQQPSHQQGTSLIEMTVVVLSLCLACYVHPSYVYSHTRALWKILHEPKCSKP
ncbi:expressed unknown protein [Seminavis robusta]|uniref:Uncharacterized protein n=1 Tax=Seminavis robusta TaxID=568900 RepID=A0A9N8EJ77_9STRA|nr:expressed unknown protein [Seminavis robusta]|eukprot:Sro1085_g239660.1 n/a (232) ;mRNA; f:33912-34607